MNVPNPGAPQQPGAVPQASGNFALVVIALVMGAVTVIITNIYIANEKQKTSEAVVYFFRLNRDVDPGHKLNVKKDVTYEAVPKKFADAWPGAIVGEETLKSYASYEFKRPGQFKNILSVDMFKELDIGAISNEIPPGHVLCSVPVDNTTISPSLTRGKYVDVYGTFRAGGKGKVIAVVRGVKINQTSSRTMELVVRVADAPDILAVTKHHTFDRNGFNVVILGEAPPGASLGLNREDLKGVGVLQ